jgi:HTH-type transcriptional regulator/antitoxin HigA
METMKYKVIKSKAQYHTYCKALEELLTSGTKNKAAKEEIELLTLLIETWDEAHNTFAHLDPVQLLTALMEEHSMKAKDLVEVLGVSKGLVSDILNYKKGMSKEIIRTLSTHFAISQEAFNRPYQVDSSPVFRSKSKREVVHV